jgi:hypothetical protein
MAFRCYTICIGKQRGTQNDYYTQQPQIGSYLGKRYTQIQHTKRKLKQLGILAFDYGNGAILIHKDNPKLSVEIIDCKDIDGKTYIGGTFTNTVDGEDFCTILRGETA